MSLNAPRWHCPLPLRLAPTTQSESFRTFGVGVTGLPLAPHPGAYGVQRRHHVHEGIDLYCEEGTPVMAVEAGTVVAVMPFTGPAANLPWWLDTQAVLIEGHSGVVLYGELVAEVVCGAEVRAGQRLGTVARVLRHDKGRPTAMLHLELHEPGARTAPEWLTPEAKPASLRDPTPFLMQCQFGGSGKAHRTAVATHPGTGRRPSV